MTCSHAYQPLFRHAGLTVGDFRCRPVDDDDNAEEAVNQWEIAFVRRGIFRRQVANRTEIADPTRAMIFAPGEPYRISHPVAGGDDCTVISVRPDAFSAMIDDETLPFGIVPIDADLHLEHWRLLTLAARPDLNELALHETTLAVLDGLITSGRRWGGRDAPAIKVSTRRCHRDLVRATVTFLSRRFVDPLTLEDVSRSVHSSPYHLSRIFRRETGRSIHEHLTQIRLRTALCALADGADDLTALALELGFCSAGHFGAAFRRAFGVSPSQARRELAA